MKTCIDHPICHEQKISCAFGVLTLSGLYLQVLHLYTYGEGCKYTSELDLASVLLFGTLDLI